MRHDLRPSPRHLDDLFRPIGTRLAMIDGRYRHLARDRRLIGAEHCPPESHVVLRT